MGFGFVTLNDEGSYQQAIANNNKEFLNRKIMIKKIFQKMNLMNKLIIKIKIMIFNNQEFFKI